MVGGTVRNVGSFVSNTKPIPVVHVIPTGLQAVPKVLLITEDDTEIDVTDRIVSGSYRLGTNNDYLGFFTFQIIDPEETLSSQIFPFDEVQVYFGIDVDGTLEYTLRFRGKIEKPFRDDYFLVVSGKGVAALATSRYVSYSATSRKKSDIIKDIINQNFTTLTVDNIEEDTGLRTVAYSEKLFSEIVEEICGLTHFFYIDQNYNAHYFEKGTRLCETEVIAEDSNHIITQDYGPNSESVSTKVRVYGKEIGGVQIFASSESDTTVTRGVPRELKVVDKSIETSIQAREHSNNLFTMIRDVPFSGMVKSTVLPTLNQGEQLFIGVPRDGLKPGFYEIQSFEHTFPDLQTTVQIEKKQFDLKSALSTNNIKSDNVAQLVNPKNLDFCYLFDFSVDSGSHSGTKIEDGLLLLISGGASGTWESDTISLTSNPTSMWFIVSGENLSLPDSASSTRLWFSLDAGNNWRLFNPGALPTVPLGTELKIRLVINSSTTSVSAVGAQYIY